MYDQTETSISYKYLKTVTGHLPEPIGILGGWAVYFQVNERFRRAQGLNYLGSRDIDLAFHIDTSWDEKTLRESALAKSIKILENKLGFTSVMFRFVKEIDRETGEVVKPGKMIYPHQRFAMSVDPIVDYAPPNFKQVFGFYPITVPILKVVFEEKSLRTELMEFDRKLLLPAPEVLVATKLLSIGERDKRDKKIKDLCDLFALLWYSGHTPMELKKKVAVILPKADIDKGFKSITEEDVHNAAEQVKHDISEMKKILFQE